jgi:hypothetical protein
MRRFFENRFAFLVTCTLFTSAFAWNMSHGLDGIPSRHHSQVDATELIAHGPTMPPDPWDGVNVAHGPTMPPDPWDGVNVAHGPTMPPDPWDGVKIAHGPTMPPDPWDGVKVAHGPTMPPDPWDGRVA